MASSERSRQLEQWLVDNYPTAYRTACLILRHPAIAEEVVQDVFVRAWRFRDALPPGEGRRPWLYRALVSACERARRTEGTGEERTAGSAIDSLPEHLRVVAVLRYFTGLSDREIATATRCRPGAARSRLQEARRLLHASPVTAEGAGR